MFAKVLRGWYRQRNAPKRKKWHKVISKPTAFNIPLFELACGIEYLNRKEFDDQEWKRSPCGTQTCKNCERAVD